MVNGSSGGGDGTNGQSPDGDATDSDQSKAKVWAWALAFAVVFAVLAGAYAIASSSDLDGESANGTAPVITQPASTTTTKAASTTAKTSTTKPSAATKPTTPTTAGETTTTEIAETTEPSETTSEPPTTSTSAPVTTAVPTSIAITTIPPTGMEIVPGLRFGVSAQVIRDGFQAVLLNKRACDAMGLLTSIPAFSGPGQAITPELIKEYVSAWRTLSTLISASRTDGVSAATADVRLIFGAAFDLIEADGYAPSSLARFAQPINVNGRLVNGAELAVAVATKHQWELSHCPSDLSL